MSGCFDQRRDERLELFACDPDGDRQACCSKNHRCATNGLCADGAEGIRTFYFVHGCTVDDWNADSCVKQCFNATGDGVKQCGNGMFCCYGLEGCDCDDENEVFSLGPVRFYTDIPADATHEAIGTSTTARTTSTESTTTTTSSSTTSSSTDPPIEPPSNDSAARMGIGLGVGLGVGIPLLAISAGLLWFCRKRRAKKRTEAGLSTAGRTPVEYGTSDLYPQGSLFGYPSLKEHAAHPNELGTDQPQEADASQGNSHYLRSELHS